MAKNYFNNAITFDTSNLFYFYTSTIVGIAFSESVFPDLPGLARNTVAGIVFVGSEQNRISALQFGTVDQAA